MGDQFQYKFKHGLVLEALILTQSMILTQISSDSGSNGAVYMLQIIRLSGV